MLASLQPLPNDRDRIATVEALRGVAALAVAWFHVTNANTAFPRSEWLRASGEWGWLGVESFFVISGFVLPLAMYRAGFRLGDAGRFLTRRLIRLHPAYLASLVATLALWWVSSLSPGFDRQPPSIEQVLLHLAYLPALAGYDWLNAVYWTLGIEIQFYLVLACTCPLLTHPRRIVRVLWLAAAVALSLMVPSELFVFRYLAVFATGATVFLMSAGLLDRVAALVAVSLLAFAVWFVHGVPAAVVAMGTAAFIAFDAAPVWRPLASIGALSYSLYLIHAPVSGRIVNLGARYADGAVAELVVAATAMVVSLAAAYVLYVLVERPSLRLASRLRRTRDVAVVPDTSFARSS